MDIKHYLIALFFAILGSLAITLIFWLSSLISWILVWAIFVFILIPVGICAIKFWIDNDCYDLEDFFDELFDKEDNTTNQSSINEDW
jgi:hypothetical protein